MKRLFKIAAAVMACAVLHGCAVMSEEECRATDWGEKGYEDGLAGKGSGWLREYKEACKNYVRVDEAAYRDGRRQGAEQYCTRDRAYQNGINGASLTDICDQTSKASEFKTYYNRGANVKNVRDQIAWFDNQYASMQNLASDPDFSGAPFLYGLMNGIYNARSSLATYANDVENRAYYEDFVVIDFTQRVTSMPGWREYQNIKDSQEMFRRARNKMHDLERDMDRDRDCIRDNMRKDGGEAQVKRCSDALHRHEREWRDLDTWYRRAHDDVRRGYQPHRCPGC